MINRQMLEHVLKLIHVVPKQDGNECVLLYREISRRLSDLDLATDIQKTLIPQFAKLRSDFSLWSREAIVERARPAICELEKIIKSTLDEPIPAFETRFSAMKDDVLRQILERDLMEAEHALNAGNWKSSIVLCGSILEAALYEYLLRKPVWTMAQSGVPKNRAKQSKEISSQDLYDQWSLQELVKFACVNGLIKSRDEVTITAALRNPRNLIHPMKEKRKEGSVDEYTAKIGYFMLLAILDELSILSDPT